MRLTKIKVDNAGGRELFSLLSCRYTLLGHVNDVETTYQLTGTDAHKVVSNIPK